MNSYSIFLMALALVAVVAVFLCWVQIRWELREMQHTIDRLKEELP